MAPAHEGVDGADDGFGLLDLGIMPRPSNDHQLCGGERRGERLSVGRLGKPVRLSPEHQRRQIDPMQPALQARIVQVWPPTIVGEHVALAREFLELAGGHRRVARRMSLPVGEKHREGLDVGHVEEIGEVALFPAGELHAHRRDEDQLGEPRVIAHAHLERNPSAEGRADENHVVELQLVEEIEIEVGQIVDRSEVGRTGRCTVAWMARRNHAPLLCEGVEMRPYLLEILLGMQVEKRRARACDMRLDREALDIECFHFDRPVQAFLSALETAASQGLQRGHLRLWPRWPELQDPNPDIVGREVRGLSWPTRSRRCYWPICGDTGLKRQAGGRRTVFIARLPVDAWRDQERERRQRSLRGPVLRRNCGCRLRCGQG